MAEPSRHSTSVGDPLPARLAPPGAGLPILELFAARLLVRWKARRTSRAAAEALFAAERDAILDLVKTSVPASLSTPVLIPRLQGMEDSSRNWSVLMTLDHLRIVNLQIASVIAQLAQGEVPGRAASTAAVKPDRGVDAAVIKAFDTACRTFEETTASVANLKTAVKFAHPWFGPLDAAGWHFMAAFHMGLHRKQVERILEAGP